LSKRSREELIWAFIAAVRASQTAVDLLDEAVGEALGLHRTDVRCLDILDQEGPITAGRLAELARISPGATTTALDRLEGKGLARRVRDTKDRRRVLVEVTPELHRLAEQVYGKPEEAVRELDVYTDEQLELLIAFHEGSVAYQQERLRRLEELIARRDSEGGSPPASG
jgi:DNA-binding MarR family transcriptional regulator